MGVMALAIDAILPALTQIRRDLDLESDSTAVSALITAFLFGSGLGFVPAGLLADRFGRRPVLWGGLGLYIVGAAGAALAPSLAWMLVARVVWGIGAAGPRVAAVAMVRDSYEGDQMARQMSFMMVVFILVPSIAPTLGAGLIEIGPWEIVFWFCALAALAVLAASTQLPRTLPVSARRALSFREIRSGWRTFFTAPGTPGYLIAMTVLFGAFAAYLSGLEIIVDDVFDLDPWLPAIFGGLSAFMGLVMFVNGRVVERVGLDRLVRWVLIGVVTSSSLFVVVALSTDGQPPFWLFVTVFAVVLSSTGVLQPNLNSAAMKPMAAVAGSAASLIGTIQMVLGSVIGTIISRSFNGTITPFAFGFLIAGVVALVAQRWAAKAAVTEDARHPR